MPIILPPIPISVTIMTMKLLEHEAKSILEKYGLAVPRGFVASTADEARAIAVRLGKPVFIKSQIGVSGRGKAGGILPALNPEETRQAASSLLGKEIKGCRVGSVLVEEKIDLQKQFYASVSIDRQARSFVALASASGGMDIEEIARAFPEKIARSYIDPLTGLTAVQAGDLAHSLDPGPSGIRGLMAIFLSLYQIAVESDAELVEINPLGKTDSGGLLAVDARIILDDNALFRHPEFAGRDLAREEDSPREAEARKQKLAYVDLDGDIGIIGNGAGLVMATIDLVHLLGGRPADFLDIGGGARTDIIRSGVLLVLNKPEVKALLVNILGGITRCDLVAEGIVQGLREAPVKKPIAVRMMGTNEAEGQEILRRSGIGYYEDMEQAAAAIINSRGART